MSVLTLSKSLAGKQDLLWGKNSASQTRNGTVYSIDRIRKIHPVDLLVDLKALPTIDEDNFYGEVQLKGTTAINDGNGGSFYWAETSTATADDLTVIAADDNGANPGRWLKLLTEGVSRTGDTMTGQLKGITPVAAADLTRKDYVDSRFLSHLNGLNGDGLTNPYAADLDIIKVNSVFFGSTDTATNFPVGLAASTDFIVETKMASNNVNGDDRLQTLVVTQGTDHFKTWVRQTSTGDAGWTAWFQILAPDSIISTLVPNAVNRILAAAAITGQNPSLKVDGEDVSLAVEGVLFKNGIATGNFTAGTHTFTTSGLNFGNQDLAHYEEGTFILTIQDSSFSDGEGQTYNNREGYYTRIGRVVYISGLIEILSLGTLTIGSAAYLAGLPFTSSNIPVNDLDSIQFHQGGSLNLGAPGHSVVGTIVNGTTRIVLYQWNSVLGTTVLTINEVSAGASFRFSGFYII